MHSIIILLLLYIHIHVNGKQQEKRKPARSGVMDVKSCNIQ
jgi:hypothetical protein